VTVETLRSGIDLSHVETSVRPQDDLFGHVNGRWLAEYQMPGDRATDGAFRTLYDRAEEQVRELIMQAAAAAARPVPTSNASATSTPASWTPTRSSTAACSRC
jgi:putative endopeptidase